MKTQAEKKNQERNVSNLKENLVIGICFEYPVVQHNADGLWAWTASSLKNYSPPNDAKGNKISYLFEKH